MRKGLRRGIGLGVMWVLLAAQIVWPLSCWRAVQVFRVSQRDDSAVPGDHGVLSREVGIRVARGGMAFETTVSDDRNDGAAAFTPRWYCDTDSIVRYPRPDVGGPAPAGGSERSMDWGGIIAERDWAAGNHADSEWTTVVLPWWLFALPMMAVAWWLWLWDRRDRAKGRAAFPVGELRHTEV